MTIIVFIILLLINDTIFSYCLITSKVQYCLFHHYYISPHCFYFFNIHLIVVLMLVLGLILIIHLFLFMFILESITLLF